MESSFLRTRTLVRMGLEPIEPASDPDDVRVPSDVRGTYKGVVPNSHTARRSTLVRRRERSSVAPGEPDHVTSFASNRSRVRHLRASFRTRRRRVRTPGREGVRRWHRVNRTTSRRSHSPGCGGYVKGRRSEPPYGRATHGTSVRHGRRPTGHPTRACVRSGRVVPVRLDVGSGTG